MKKELASLEVVGLKTLLVSEMFCEARLHKNKKEQEEYILICKSVFKDRLIIKVTAS